jgi:hypothetical protein
MTINNKQFCIDNLTGSLTRSAAWRRSLQAKAPPVARIIDHRANRERYRVLA